MCRLFVATDMSFLRELTSMAAWENDKAARFVQVAQPNAPIRLIKLQIGKHFDLDKLLQAW